MEVIGHAAFLRADLVRCTCNQDSAMSPPSRRSHGEEVAASQERVELLTGIEGASSRSVRKPTASTVSNASSGTAAAPMMSVKLPASAPPSHVRTYAELVFQAPHRRRILRAPLVHSKRCSLDCGVRARRGQWCHTDCQYEQAPQEITRG
jgi:hypothetical protein